jgi:hypothetical protein
MVEELRTWAAINKQQRVLKERLYQNLKGLGRLPSVQEVLDSSQYICLSGLCTHISSIVLNFLVKTGGLLFDYWIMAFVDLNLLSSTPPFLKEHYPTSSILKKLKFQVIQKWFSFALEAWSGFRKNIPQLQESIPEMNLPHFDSLLDLFKTYISCVLWFEKTKNTQNFSLRRKFVYLQLV